MSTPGRKAGARGHLRHDVGHARRLRRRFEDDATTRKQCRRDLIRDGDDGRIPRNDGGDDAHGLAGQKSDGSATGRLVPFLEIEGIREACVVFIDVADTSRDISRDGVQHAHLVRPDLGNVIGSLRYQLPHGFKNARALGMAHPGPRALVESLSRRMHRPFDISLLRGCHTDEDLFRGWRDYIDPRPGTWLDPLAVDEQAICVSKRQHDRLSAFHCSSISWASRCVDRRQNLKVSSAPYWRGAPATAVLNPTSGPRPKPPT